MRIKHILASVLLCFATLVHADEFIRVSTKSTDVVFRVSGNGRLYQSYFGRHLTDEADLKHLSRGTEAYLTHGMEDYFEPALDVRHADGNPSTLLTYVSHNQNTAADGSKYTVISLQDKEYGTKVNLHFNAYTEEDVIKTYTEITNGEKKPVMLEKYASSMLHLTGGKYWLTEFSGNWADEGHISTTPLNFGKKRSKSVV